jgi:alkyldihydroxyacetonephosphate synthase
VQDLHELQDESYRHKWWGWGPDGIDYDMHRRPDFWPWIRKTTQLPDDMRLGQRVRREEVAVPQRRHNAAFEAAIADEFDMDQVREDDDDRIAHSYGRSYRDLVRLRAGLLENPPDLVLYPRSHRDVETIVRLAEEHDVVLIAFGGGTNIVGCVEPSANEARLVVSLDMRSMNRLLQIDKDSMTAVLEPGLFGPQLEKLLNEQGVSLGHHPDSFQYSTLGGWLATRSAGTQSNVYGKIEDMVVAMRMVTPRGTLNTKPLPAASNGPDLNRIIVGSEGVLGIITEATMRVHLVPEVEDYRLLLFPTFLDGYRALHECVRKDLMPSLARLSDEAETELIFAAKYPASGFKKILQGPVKRLLKARGYTRPATMVVAFEGRRKKTQQLRREVLKIFRKHRSFNLGRAAGEAWKRAAGEAWKESRYDIPYLRDYMMDYGLIADSFETAATWSKIVPLYEATTNAIRQAFSEVTGFEGFVGAHISHLYDTGACVYFTIGVRSRENSTAPEMMDQYTAIKKAATDAIVQCGGAVSHHHAVGYEHRPWLEQEVSPAGIRSLRGMKRSLDPNGILNPGSLIPQEAEEHVP